jgi:hypothetical protein
MRGRASRPAHRDTAGAVRAAPATARAAAGRSRRRSIAPRFVGVLCRLSCSLSLLSSTMGKPLENGRSARRDRNDGSDALAERTCSPAGDALQKLVYSGVSLVFDARRGVSVGAFGGQRVQGAPSVIAKGRYVRVLRVEWIAAFARSARSGGRRVRGHRRTRSAARLDEANAKVDAAPHRDSERASSTLAPDHNLLAVPVRALAHRLLLLYPRKTGQSLAGTLSP